MLPMCRRACVPFKYCCFVCKILNIRTDKKSISTGRGSFVLRRRFSEWPPGPREAHFFIKFRCCSDFCFLATASRDSRNVALLGVVALAALTGLHAKCHFSSWKIDNSRFHASETSRILVFSWSRRWRPGICSVWRAPAQARFATLRFVLLYLCSSWRVFAMILMDF